MITVNINSKTSAIDISGRDKQVWELAHLYNIFTALDRHSNAGIIFNHPSAEILKELVTKRLDELTEALVEK